MDSLFHFCLDIEWVKGHSESHDLILTLRDPDQLELWDAFSGVRIWKKQFAENLLTFALDPFDLKRLICKHLPCFVLLCFCLSSLYGTGIGTFP